ncbi:MAG: Gfo/Idh/MocA family oxidoreductase [Opitutaceae bacterium]|nr:Gfo/Idh/MocA family oxidoreductase [Opitutaceae bacterium]
MNTQLTRRHFLGTSATAVIVAGMKAQGTVVGASNRLRVCVIGLNGRGGAHMKEFTALGKDVHVAALCDVDSNVLARGAKTVEAAQGSAPRLFRDMREVFASKEIDAVSIATPNHWHSLASIWACQAGKDVYVEKPMSHNIWEGRQVVAAAEKYSRIVQHGTQSRSNTTLIRDMKLIHDGFIGKIVESRGYVYKNGNRGSIGHGAPGAVPANLDWNLWQGPAAEQAFLAKTGKPAKSQPGLWVHYDWHYNWEYGNGEIGNQGVHQMDIACWGHNRGLPISVHSAGGRFGLDDAGQTPNTQSTTFSYADGSILTFQVRNLGSFQEMDGGDCGNSFFGTKGLYVVGKGFFSYKQGKASEREAIPVPGDSGKPAKESPFGRFVGAVRSRKASDMPMSVLDAHIGCAHCHLGNIAFRLGRSLAFDPKTERFKDEAANRYLSRDYRKGFEVPRLAGPVIAKA